MSSLSDLTATQLFWFFVGSTILGEFLVDVGRAFVRGVRRRRAPADVPGRIAVGRIVHYQPPIRAANGRVLLAPLPAIVTRVHGEAAWPQVDLVCFSSDAGASGVFYSTQVAHSGQAFAPNSWHFPPRA